VANPGTDDGQNASDSGSWRSAVIRGNATTTSPFVALEAKLTPASWNVTAAFRSRETDLALLPPQSLGLSLSLWLKREVLCESTIPVATGSNLRVSVRVAIAAQLVTAVWNLNVGCSTMRVSEPPSCGC